MKNPGKHLDLLDYTRGIAVLGVLSFHTLSTIYAIYLLPGKGLYRNFSHATFSSVCFFPLIFGEAGVPIFFVISGFCIHLSFHSSGGKWRDFFIRRIFRICPAYFAALIFFMMFWMEQSQVTFNSVVFWKQFLSHFFLVHNFHPSTLPSINGSFWTLAIEAQLYLLYPALLYLVGKFGWRRAMAMLAVCEILIRGLDSRMLQSVEPVEGIGQYVLWLIANSAFAFWFSWTLGAFLADAYLKNEKLPFLNQSRLCWLLFAVVSYFVKPLYPFRFFLFAIATAVVMSRLLSGGASKIKFPKSSLALLGKIGVWSYSIYLIHQPLLPIFFHSIDWIVPPQFHSETLAFLVMVSTWLAIIPFSVLWYHTFEVPGIALGKWIIQKINPHKGGKVMPMSLSPNFGAVLLVFILFVIGTYYLNDQHQKSQELLLIFQDHQAYDKGVSP